MKIVYAGPFSYPSSQANSLRVRGMVEALVAAGHEVHVVCLGEVQSDEVVEGIRVTRIPEYAGGILSRFRSGVRGLFLGDVTTRWLEQNGIRPDALILYGTHTGYLLRLSRFCRLRNVSLFLDVVEWFQPSHLPGGALGPFAIANELSMRIFARRAKGVFAISRYLEAHFRKLGLPVLRVPPLFKTGYVRPSQFHDADGKLHLCYVGTPGRKELLSELFAGLGVAASAGASFRMHFVGMTEEGARASGLVADTVPSSIRFYGQIPNKDAVAIIGACDFMLLLRPIARFSSAGFPSKVAESLSLGTAVITNLTSNLKDYLDEMNSFIIPSMDAEGVASTICKVATLPSVEIQKMKIAAKSTGECFSPQAYSGKISAFLAGGEVAHAE